MSEAIVYNLSESLPTYLSINPSIYLPIYLHIIYMGVSLNGGTPKTPQNVNF